ncbi:MAG: ABC transporter ATP-binding protein [Magnetococcales bacterium]|nr:ABC transporter ATP-binding protein [Magnetococcales bacterium]MBF0114241.1 ABC transporter ATP-binding protein [Magnetococcales bacterium]
MNMLQWQGVSLHKAEVRILAEVSLALARGELLGIIGPNGAGKSALLRCAVGLERCSQGEVRVEGTPLPRLAAAERARRLAFLPQQGETLWPIAVADAVAIARLPHQDEKRASGRQAVEQALQQVGMRHLAARAVTTLSGGERALVLLARALAVESALLLLDEPVTALDPHHQLAVMELLRRLADAGKAIALVLHDLTLAARFCHRLALLHAGRLVAEGAAEQVLQESLLQQVYAVQGRYCQIEGQSLVIPWQRISLRDTGGA